MAMKIPFLHRKKGRLSLKEASSEELIPPEAVLVGIFPKAKSTCTWPVSPTLFLNANLGQLSPEELFRLALAEKGRLEENLSRSYTVDTRKPVAVLSKEPSKLSQFVEIYGGLLEIRPFLLGKDSAFPVIEDLRIEALEDGYRLSYLLWSPFDEEKCNFCAQCGRSCPSKALKPDLTIDPLLCDGCRQCEKVCPSQALDLSRYEEISEDFQYLLFLEEAPEGLSRLAGHFFLHDQIEELFKVYGVFQVIEAVRFEPGSCQYEPRLKVGCRLCLETCPANALEPAAEGRRINHLKCIDCGRCVSLCPTGALQESRFDDRSFFSYFRDLDFLQGKVVVIGSEASLQRLWWERGGSYQGTFFLAHPNPQAIHQAQILFLLALGAQGIIFLEKAPREALHWSNYFFEALFNCQPVQKMDVAEFKPQVLAPLRLQNIFQDFSFSGRRLQLARLLYFFWEEAQRPTLHLEGETFGSLKLEKEICTLCLACLNACHTGALKADPKNFALLGQTILCVACNACVALCPEKALVLTPGVDLKENAFSSRVLIQDEPLRCTKCGKIFGTKKSLLKVSQCLQETGRFQELIPLLELCEDCRVRKMFDENV